MTGRYIAEFTLPNPKSALGSRHGMKGSGIMPWTARHAGIQHRDAGNFFFNFHYPHFIIRYDSAWIVFFEKLRKKVKITG
jgi:hypothetical protein